jgi:Uma2 family endonuclease
MATKTLPTVEQHAALEEPVGVRYELSNGELIVTPTADHYHNVRRDDVSSALRAFVRKHRLGEVTSETDMKLAGDVVRRPDVAFIRAERLQGVDLGEVPLPIAPDLVIEIVWKTDRADNLLLKVKQYLQAGAGAVWLMYPNPRLAYRYVAGKLEPEVRSQEAGDRFDEPNLLPGFSLSLAEIFG